MRIFLISLALLWVVACGDADTPEDYLARAKEYIADADIPAATLSLQSALRLAPDSAEARSLLGKVYLQAGFVADAERELLRAQKLGWTADDVRPALARSLLAQGKFADVLQLDSEALAPAAAAQLLASQAAAALSAGQFEQARELAAQAKSADPQSIEARLAEAANAVQLDDPAAALTLIESIIVAAPDNGEAWWLKGQALMRAGKLQEARGALDKSVALADSNYSYRITRVLLNLQLRDFDAARADIAPLLEQYPRNPALNYARGLLLFEERQYRKAIAALTLAEPAAAQFPLTLFYLGNAHLAEQDLVLAGKYTARFIELAPDDSRGLKQQAVILLLQDKVAQAQRVLQPVLDQNPNDIAALNIAANALLLDDQADLALVLYARIAQLQPDWQVVPLGREVALVTAASTDDQSDATEDGDNFPQTEVLKILSSLRSKDYPTAIETAKAYQFRALESVATYRLLGMIYLAAGEPEQARAEFERALLQSPGDAVANQALAQLALAANDGGAARVYYEAALDANPDELTTLLQLAALEATENHTEAMLARLEQAAAAQPQALEPRLSLANHYLTTSQPDKVEGVFAPLSALQRRSPRVLELTGRAQLALQQHDRAVATLRQLVEVSPASADAQYMLAMAANATGDVQTAKQALSAAIERDPGHVPSLVGLARIARLDGDDAAFERHLDALVKLSPEAPDVLRLRAQHAQLQGRPGDGLAFAQSALLQAPSTQTLLELTALQNAAGRSDDARNALQSWIRKHPGDVAVRLALARELEANHRRKAAQAQYLEVLKQEPGNITALNNLAWNLRRDNPRQALNYIRLAVAISPNVPALLDTLAVVLSLNGEHDAARRNIERALAAAPEDPSVRYHAAMLAAARGDTAAAIAALQALLAGSTEAFAERAEAKALLQSLSG